MVSSVISIRATELTRGGREGSFRQHVIIPLVDRTMVCKEVAHEDRHKYIYMEDKSTAAEGLCLYTHIHTHPTEVGGGEIVCHQDGPYCICHMDDAEEKTGGSNSTETKVDRRCRWTAEETSMFVPFGQESVPSQPIREKNEKTFRRKC